MTCCKNTLFSEEKKKAVIIVKYVTSYYFEVLIREPISYAIINLLVTICEIFYITTFTTFLLL